VTLLLVSRTPAGIQLFPEADSSSLAAAAALPEPIAKHAAASELASTGTERTPDGTLAVAVRPVIYRGKVADVIVYSSTVSDVVHSVTIVQHQILIAGGIALVLTLIGGYLVARALAQVATPTEVGDQITCGPRPAPAVSRVVRPNRSGSLCRRPGVVQHSDAQC